MAQPVSRVRIETVRLRIAERLPEDSTLEQVYAGMYPELEDLDPTVGEFRNPELLSVFLKRDGWHIGTCCLYNRTQSNVEIGLRIFIPEYWGQGYGKEIVEGLCFYAFSSFSPVDEVVLKTPVLNTRAFMCYDKCGFKEYARTNIGGVDMILMSRRK